MGTPNLTVQKNANKNIWELKQNTAHILGKYSNIFVEEN